MSKLPSLLTRLHHEESGFQSNQVIAVLAATAIAAVALIGLNQQCRAACKWLMRSLAFDRGWD